MGTPYAGNPASFPANVTTIDDSDIPSAVVLSTPLEQLADRTAWLQDAVDTTIASLTAAITAATPQAAMFRWQLDDDGDGQLCNFIELINSAGIAAISDAPNSYHIQFTPGVYVLSVGGVVYATDTTNPRGVQLFLRGTGGGTRYLVAYGQRFSASGSDRIIISAPPCVVSFATSTVLELELDVGGGTVTDDGTYDASSTSQLLTAIRLHTL